MSDKDAEVAAQVSGSEQMVRKWLQASGLPLELQAKRYMERARASSVTHAHHHVDPVSGELREIDVLADFDVPHVARGHAARLTLRVVIECKSTKDGTPWVGYMADGRLIVNDTTDQLPTFETVAFGGFSVSSVQHLWSAPAVAHTGEFAYHLATAKEGKEPSFDAVRQVLAAVRGLAPEAAVERRDDGAVILLPVLVVGVPLFAATFSSAGSIDLASVDELLLVSRMAGESLRSVWLVTEAGLPGFADKMRVTVDRLGRAAW